MSYKMLGINEYLDNALIASIDEYGSSTSSSNHSFEENVVSNGVPESMC